MALQAITPMRLQFASDVPHRSRFDDICRPGASEIERAHAAYLHACGLPQAWAARSSYVILAIGFGAGLNFLLAWAAWRADPARAGRLHFVAIETHPYQADDLLTLHADWPQFAALSAELRAHWPMLTPGFHRIELDQGRVRLTLALGEVAACLAQVEGVADVIYLDSIYLAPSVPDRTSATWQPGVYKQLARLARPGARLVSNSVTAGECKALTAVGFDCRECADDGHPQPRLEAQFTDPYAHKTRGRARQFAHAMPRHVAVVGAGVAGCAVAHALGQRGVRVSVLDAVAVGAGASGNPVAVFRPLPSLDDNRMSRLTRAAFLYSLRAWTSLGAAVVWSRCGVLQCAQDAAHCAHLARVLAVNAAPPEFARVLAAAETAQRVNGLVSEVAVLYPNAGWIDPASLCRAWLDQPEIDFLPPRRVAALSSAGAGWQVHAADGHVLIEADAVVVANACDAASLLPLPGLQGIRGQINCLPGAVLSNKLNCVLARDGYLSPMADGDYVVGASYEYDVDPALPCVTSARGDADNRARLHAIVPGLLAPEMSGRVAIRAVMADRFPLLGQVQPGLFVAAGYASRGVVWSALLGEALACLICDEPLPIERELMRAMNPLR